MIDTERLLAWLDGQVAVRTKPLVSAIYAGLAMRVQRGDFNETKESSDE